ncbi:IS3 family transposase [Streptomyces sp. NPDC005799]|uniref:IS3 family transposase n=1 Tax=Streptomyces sp. NPDC005799 TaxID=3154678 RepID=UPI0033F8AB49
MGGRVDRTCGRNGHVPASSLQRGREPRTHIRGRTFTTSAEANLALFEYIDGFYNSRRNQERLGFLSPIEFEEKHYAEQATAEPTNLNTHQPLLTS